jgi:glutamyl-tRNA synthetase
VVAKKNNGQFIVRIEDTDRARFVAGSEERILSSLAWLGISHDEGTDVGGPYAPYRQSDRLEVYKKYALELVTKGHAYYCFCTTARLEEMRKKQESEHKPPMYDGLCKALDQKESASRVAKGEKHVVRLMVPDSGTTTFTDLIRGEISFENKLIDDQVILKSDGFPTYHLGVVVDDHLMEISHIIRGEEWISSTPKHILLYKFFGWDTPLFAHMPLLRNPDKSKLSKRKNPVWVSQYKDQGFEPEAVLNYLANLGWSHPEGKEIFSIDEMTTKFDLKDVQTTTPIFDVKKLEWMNKQYLMKKTSKDYVVLVGGASIYGGSDEFNNIANGTASWVQPRITTKNEYDKVGGFYHAPPKTYERKVNQRIVGDLIEFFEHCEWSKKRMEDGIRAYAELKEYNSRDVFMELRIALTGKSVGPPLLESIEYLKREKTLEYLRLALKA